MLTFWQVTRSIALLWIILIASFLFSYTVSMFYIQTTEKGTLTLNAVGRETQGNAISPERSEVDFSDIPMMWDVWLICGVCILYFFYVGNMISYCDPEHRSSFFSRIVVGDKSGIVLPAFLSRLPGFRWIPKDKLLFVFYCQLLASFTLPVAVGWTVGILHADLLWDSSHTLRIVITANLLPIGLFLGTSVLIPFACMHARFRIVKDDIYSGRIETAWAVLRADLRWKHNVPRIIVSLALILAAGIYAEVFPRLLYPILHDLITTP